MRYNTLVCNIVEIERQDNGDYALSGIVLQSVGEDFRADEMLSVAVKGNKAEYLGDLSAGIFLLEKVDPNTGYCQFPTRIPEGKTAIPALIGPLQVSWTDNANKYQVVTLDKAGLEGDALDKANRVSKQFPATMRVYRDLIELDEDGAALGARVTPTAQWHKTVAEMIQDDPRMTSIIVRDGRNASMVRLGWDKDAEQHVLVPPTYKDGTPVRFSGESVEIIPVQQMNFLTNRFNPKKSSAVAEINHQVGKSERQLAFEAKLYPQRGSFASGVAMLRDLPSGGHTLERVAASFPTWHYKSVPGALHIQEKRPDQVNVIETVKDLLGTLGVPQADIQAVLEKVKNRPGPTHAVESELANDTRPGLPKAGYIEETQRAARQGQAALQQVRGAANASAATRSPSTPAVATPAVATPAAATPAAATATPTPAAPAAAAPTPPAQDLPPAPRVKFGRRR